MLFTCFPLKLRYSFAVVYLPRYRLSYLYLPSYVTVHRHLLPIMILTFHLPLYTASVPVLSLVTLSLSHPYYLSMLFHIHHLLTSLMILTSHLHTFIYTASVPVLSLVTLSISLPSASLPSHYLSTLSHIHHLLTYFDAPHLSLAYLYKLPPHLLCISQRPRSLSLSHRLTFLSYYPSLPPLPSLPNGDRCINTASLPTYLAICLST